MNQKGQAVIESVILLTICTVVSVTFIQLGLHLFSEIVVEDLLEQTLICKLQKQSDCTAKLKKKLHDLNYTAVTVIDRSHSEKAKILVQWNSSLTYSAALESELSFDLTVR